MTPIRLGTSGDGPARRIDDPRLVAFRDWTRAVDRRDVPAMRLATKALRQLGVSVVATGRGKP